jgi:hypothetical protein
MTAHFARRPRLGERLAVAAGDDLLEICAVRDQAAGWVAIARGDHARWVVLIAPVREQIEDTPYGETRRIVPQRPGVSLLCVETPDEAAAQSLYARGATTGR